uniref:Uncharacterized protein n=1 Tax=Chromera velia CCMP2878 TaxID=1169474 RepID=A0A0G4HIY4_9ALVE|eukprot:Cvel_28079.t1-p1 / transcript=Cvel_28079.t1 / gene=Cvel_28079 / organism=Chromera_velia_CCMP2878 / gene_product=hypothetical protein / transcript_product=hypothetical protein / location=Cvel_scaffold3610:5880-6710(+) / protein_length=277 / sequence_SO=supercontig / SO=protein_coding / is_pseudo=false
MCILCDANNSVICGHQTAYLGGAPLYQKEPGKSQVLEKVCCCCCIPLPQTWATGLPTDAQPLTPNETQELLTFLSGSWKLQYILLGHMGSPSMNRMQVLMTYENVIVVGQQYTISGGMHLGTRKHGDDTVTIPVPNRPLPHNIIPYRSQKTGHIFLDNVGTQIKDIDAGQITFDFYMPDVQIVWQREWRRGGFDRPANAPEPPYSIFGHIAPKQQTMPAPTAQQNITINVVGEGADGGTPQTEPSPPNYVDTQDQAPPNYAENPAPPPAYGTGAEPA